MTFKIKLEDKAAFLNRMEKQDEAIDSKQIKDNKLEGYFEVTIDDPKQLEVVKAILKKSPKINTMSEMKKKLTKKELAEMVRQELQAVIAEKKKVKDEDKKKKLDENQLDEGLENELLQLVDPVFDFLKDNAGFLATIGGIAGLAKWVGDKASKDPELRKSLDKATGAGSEEGGAFGRGIKDLK